MNQTRARPELSVHEGSADALAILDSLREKIVAGDVTAVVLIYDGPKLSGRRQSLRSWGQAPILITELELKKRELLDGWEDEA
jgi:hypothetical protein